MVTFISREIAHRAGDVGAAPAGVERVAGPVAAAAAGAAAKLKVGTTGEGESRGYGVYWLK
eukprot:1821852-Pleurochrysis_carterae.AAC.1